MKNAILIAATLFAFSGEVYGQHWGKLGNGIKPGYGAPKDLYGDSVSNQLYAVGVFEINDSSAANRLLAWNGSQWNNVGQADTGINTLGIPQSLTRLNDKLFMTGAFSTMGNIPANNIAYWDGINWNALTEEPNEGGSVLQVINNELYIGGVFDSVGTVRSPSIAKWDGTQSHPVGGGIITGNSNPASIFTIAEYHGKVYAGGLFVDSANGAPLNLLRFNGINWEHVPGWTNGVNSYIDALAVYHDELYVGGQFFLGEGSVSNHITKWNDTLWKPVGDVSVLEYAIRKLLVYHDELYACGDFSTIGGVPASHIAKWDGSKWCNLGNDYFDNQISEMTVWNDTLYIGGAFETINGDTFHHVAKWIGGNFTDSCGVNVGIPQINSNVFFFSVFPNPTDDVIYLDGSLLQNQIQEIEVLNMLGQRVLIISKEQIGNQSKITLDLKSFASGVYLVNVKAEKATYSGKVIKQ